MKVKLLFLFLLFIGSVFGQIQRKIVKIGCIDIQQVIDKVSGDKVLRKFLENKKGTFLQKAETLSTEIATLKDILAKEYNNLPKDRIEAYEEEILFKQQQLKAFVEEQEAYIRKVDDELSAKVLKNIYDYIKQVADKYGYSMIIEKGTAVIYVNEDLDITDDVLDLLEKATEPYKNY
jgi:outer membrane protein